MCSLFQRLPGVGVFSLAGTDWWGGEIFFNYTYEVAVGNRVQLLEHKMRVISPGGFFVSLGCVPLHSSQSVAG